jgi:hypothetical protein
LVYHAYLAHHYGIFYPYGTFLCCPWDHFNDFFNHLRYAPDPYHLDSPDPNHLPFLYVVLNFLKGIPEIHLFIILIASFVGTFFTWTARHFNGIAPVRQVFFSLTLFISLPVVFALDRGNFELAIFVFLCLFIALYYSHPRLSLFFLCLTVLIKPFPAVFFILPISDKRYREVFWSLVSIAVITLISFALLPGGILENIPLYLRILGRYEVVYEAGQYGFTFNSSLFGAIRYIIFSINPHLDLVGNFLVMKYPYLLLVGVIAVGIVTIVIKFEKTFWKKVLLLCLLMDLAPFISAEYRMLHLLIPAVMFLGYSVQEKSDLFYVITFGLLFIPKDYFRLSVFPDVSIAVFIDPLIMLILAVFLGVTAIRRAKPNMAYAVESNTADLRV